MARSYFVAKRYEEAIAAFQRNADRSGPMAVINQAILAPATGNLGRVEEANYRIHEIRRCDPNLTLTHAATKQRFADKNERKRLLNGLWKAGLPE